MLIYLKTYEAVSRFTLSKWTLHILQKSAIDVDKYKADSMRHALTSHAQCSMSDNQVMKFVGWSKASTFATCYKKQ